MFHQQNKPRISSLVRYMGFLSFVAAIIWDEMSTEPRHVDIYMRRIRKQRHGSVDTDVYPIVGSFVRRGEVSSPNGLGDPTPTHSIGVQTVFLTHVEHLRNGDVLFLISPSGATCMLPLQQSTMYRIHQLHEPAKAPVGLLRLTGCPRFSFALSLC